MSDTPYTPAPTLQRIRELQAQGVSLRDIAEILTAEGVPLPGRRKTWHHTAVHTCLNQPASAPSAPASPTLVAELVQALKPLFDAALAQALKPLLDAVLAKMDQPPAPASPPIEASGRFWPRTRWAGGLLGGVWGAEVMSGVVLLAVWWTL